MYSCIQESIRRTEATASMLGRRDLLKERASYMISGAQKAATHDQGSCCRHLSVLDAMKWVFLRLTQELQKFSRISEELLSTVTVSGSEEGLPRSSSGSQDEPCICWSLPAASSGHHGFSSAQVRNDAHILLVARPGDETRKGVFYFRNAQMSGRQQRRLHTHLIVQRNVNNAGECGEVLQLGRWGWYFLSPPHSLPIDRGRSHGPPGCKRSCLSVATHMMERGTLIWMESQFHNELFIEKIQRLQLKKN